jgi:Ca2+-dependent lipid-binding protein
VEFAHRAVCQAGGHGDSCFGVGHCIQGKGNQPLNAQMRIRLQLISSIPVIKTLQICFVEHPTIDFVLKPLKSLDLMDLPGLSHWLHSIIDYVLKSQLVAPNSLTINLEKEFLSKISSKARLKQALAWLSLKSTSCG